MNALTFAELREAITKRQAQWDVEDRLPLLFHAIELGGEAGEVLNLVKKLVREDLGLAGSRASVTDLANELADVVIAVDLLAMKFGIDLGLSVTKKFNATSAKLGLSAELFDIPQSV